jgi:zinc transporter ZupT
MPINTFTVFLFALLTAVATGLGALPFVFFRSVTRPLLGISSALAAGLMTAASFGLVIEGWSYGWVRILAGAAVGVGFMLGAHRIIQHRGDLSIGNLQGADARKALLIVAVMTVHSFAEGIGVGVAFGDGAALGIFITIAIAIHNIPEGLAISLVLVPRGQSVGRAAAWSVFSSLPQPLLAVPAYLFVQAFTGILPFGLGFAAGAMLWMVISELVPEARRDAPGNSAAWAGFLAATAMMAFQAWLGG